MKKIELVKCTDFMGLPVYWINNLPMELAHKSQNVGCVYQNTRWNKSVLCKEKKYICDITLSPHHETGIEKHFNSFKDAKEFIIKEFDKL